MIGLALFSRGSELAGLLLGGAKKQTLYYPHVPSDSHWATGLAVYNPFSASVGLTVIPYMADGTVLGERNLVLLGHNKWLSSFRALGLPHGVAWLEIQATVPVSGLEVIGTSDETRLGGLSSTDKSAREGIFMGVEEAGYSGIVLANVTDQNVNVALTAFSQSIEEAAYLGFSSNGNIVAMQLNGSMDNLWLDGSSAEPVW